MGSPFKSCPIDVVVEIIKLLELADIRNLRLSCTSLATKSSFSPHVQSLYHTQRVDLIQHSLGTLLLPTQYRLVAFRVGRDLTLRVLASNNPLPSVPRQTRRKTVQRSLQQSNVNLPGHLFNSISNVSPSRRLASLSLEVLVPSNLGAKHQPVDPKASWVWKPIWQAMAETFHATFRALATSRLQIESIGYDPRQQRCSLAADELSRLDWHNAGLAKSLSPVRSLSISISNRVFDLDDGDEVKIDTQSNHEDAPTPAAQINVDVTGFANLLRALSRLEDFNMHYFSMPVVLEGQKRVFHERHLQHLSMLASLPSLKSCSLQGVHTTEKDLLTFVKRTQVRELSPKAIWLGSGTFRPVFDYCTSAAAPITKLSLSGLFEGWILVRFIQNPLVYVPFYRSGDESLEKQGDEVKKYIHYDARYNSPTTRSFLSSQIREYGLNYG
jgi:hypothetical protein